MRGLFFGFVIGTTLVLAGIGLAVLTALIIGGCSGSVDVDGIPDEIRLVPVGCTDAGRDG